MSGSLAPVRLYHYPSSGNGYKVRLALAQLGIAHEEQEIDIQAGESSTDEFLALNPDGRTPVLALDDGSALAESAAILLHVAEGTPLLPSGAADRGEVLRWLFFEQNRIEPTIGTARYRSAIGTAEPAVLAWLAAQARTALAVLERCLAEHEFAAAGRYTVADIALYAYTHLAPEAGVPLAETPAVAAWCARVEAQPGWFAGPEPIPAP